MGPQEIYHLLESRGLWYETDHFSSHEELISKTSDQLRYPAGDAKNLFLRDDKRREYYLLTVREGRQVDLKEFRRQHGTRPLSFASEDELMELLGLLPGTVNPIALLHDREHRVHWFLDRVLLEAPGIIDLHPNDGTVILWMRTRELIDLLAEQEIPATLADF